MPQHSKRVIGHHRTAFIFDLVEQADDFGAANAVNLAAPKFGKHESLEHCSPLLDAA